MSEKKKEEEEDDLMDQGDSDDPRSNEQELRKDNTRETRSIPPALTIRGQEEARAHRTHWGMV